MKQYRVIRSTAGMPHGLQKGYLLDEQQLLSKKFDIAKLIEEGVLVEFQPQDPGASPSVPIPKKETQTS